MTTRICAFLMVPFALVACRDKMSNKICESFVEPAASTGGTPPSATAKHQSATGASPESAKARAANLADRANENYEALLKAAQDQEKRNVAIAEIQQKLAALGEKPEFSTAELQAKIAEEGRKKEVARLARERVFLRVLVAQVAENAQAGRRVTVEGFDFKAENYANLGDDVVIAKTEELVGKLITGWRADFASSRDNPEGELWRKDPNQGSMRIDGQPAKPLFMAQVSAVRSAEAALASLEIQLAEKNATLKAAQAQEETRLRQERQIRADVKLEPAPAVFPVRMVASEPKCAYKDFGRLVKDQHVLLPITGLFGLVERVVNPIPEKNRAHFKWLDAIERRVAGWLLERAIAAKNLRERELVIDAADLRKRFGAFNDLRPYLPRLQALEFVGMKGGGVLVRFRRVDGRVLEATLDRDWQRSCNLLDRAFDADGQIAIETREVPNGTKGKMLHPFEGRACSQARLKDYFVLNLSSPGDTNRKQPELVLLVTKDGPLRGANAFYRGEGGYGRQSRLSAELRDFFYAP